jgi:hypothetical protein
MVSSTTASSSRPRCPANPVCTICTRTLHVNTYPKQQPKAKKRTKTFINTLEGCYIVDGVASQRTLRTHGEREDDQKRVSCVRNTLEEEEMGWRRFSRRERSG